MKLLFELEGGDGAQELPGGGNDLAAFLSFAAMRGFGANHPLIALADRLHDTHRVPMGPLSMFYEAEPEDAEDREKLELAWQDARDLANSLSRLLTASDDRQVLALIERASAPSLLADLAALNELATAAATSHQNVRMTYVL